MITLYSYPQLFGLPDNNPFGLKVDTFLRLAKIPYQHEHILDTKNAPRGQLPYLIDGQETVTDSNMIISYLIEKYKISIDKALTKEQKHTHFLITRMLDSHLYWVISYSRWQDEQFWPLFKNEFVKQLQDMPESILDNARSYNIEKYNYQGIGRYSKEEIYQSGIDDLSVIHALLADNDFIFGKTVHSLDACCYGFLANIYYFDINTPLKEFIVKNAKLARYINKVRELLMY
ncbi:glutathione S-transferase family protein [Legionella bononiensis]|uniref:Glutathione S-transferase family protein n=1 Tax=Legionella bononiensis TaxID=2793102 RepID=A0ABS1WDX9_9GAMM|nr:glutathione S-transferase family protein [Legionella bononiensis]MBL7479563.1 glutathione S-transferase family protein [Legionella bononiensis]MBL7527563.1 glutathione S-transferase family protein [Legionella bononiensis]